MAVFEKAWEISKQNEGGYVNDPHDAGGETYRGIARKFEPSWPGWPVIDRVKKVTPIPRYYTSPDLDKLAQPVYKKKYWDSIGADFIKSQAVANQLFDHTLSGLPRTIVMIKHLLNKRFGGKFDLDSTMKQNVVEAINKAPEKRFFDEFKQYRTAMFKYSAGQLLQGDPYFFLFDLFKRWNSKTDQQRKEYGSRYLNTWLRRVNVYALEAVQAASRNQGALVGLAVAAVAGIFIYRNREKIKLQLNKLLSQ